MPIRSPLLWQSLLLSLPSGTKMVQFPEFPSLNLCIQLRMICVYRIPGFPIRTSVDLCSLAAPHSFSQLATSFIGSWHLGIHRAPFTTYSYKHSIIFNFSTVLQHSVTSLPATKHRNLIKKTFNWMFIHRILLSMSFGAFWTASPGQEVYLNILR